MCEGYQPYAQYGRREDIPLPGLDFDGDPSTSHLAVMRTTYDASAQWIWGPTQNYNPLTSVVRNLGNWSSVPLPGLYDSDSKTDLVVYYPDGAMFGMLLSDRDEEPDDGVPFD